MTAPGGSLYLSAVDDRYDAERDLAIGPHCFRGQDIFGDWTGLEFIDPFAGDAALDQAQQQIAALVNSIFTDLAKRLNARHGTTYSVDFWRTLSLTWAVELAQRAWSGYVTLQKAVDLYGARELRVAVCQQDLAWQFSDTAAFYKRLVLDDTFNWWIDSQIVQILAPATAWQIEQVTARIDPVEDPTTAPVPSARQRLIRRIKHWMGYTDVIGAGVSGLLLSAFANLLPRRRARVRFRPDPDYRPGDFFPADFLELFDRLVETTLPDSLGGDFTRLEKKAAAVPYFAGRLRIGTVDLWNDREKMFAALAREAGEKLVVYQHGGLYGISKYNMLSNEFEYPGNIFFTWGWSSQAERDSYFVPLPSPYTSRVAERHRRANDDIIYVGAASFFLQQRIFAQPRAAKSLRYVAITQDFLATLAAKVRNNVLIRPYGRSAVSVDFGEITKRDYPDLPILEGDLHGALLKCRLAVLLGYSTTLNLTMAANTPTVIIWQKDFLSPREAAQPFFDDLEACGILHLNAAAAARHINKVADDVEGWWASAQVQRARTRWVERFARTDKFWWWQWMRALSKLKYVQ